MKVKNPFLHYPLYALRIYLKDGRVYNQTGMAVEVIEIVPDEEDVLTLVIESRDDGNVSHDARLLTNGLWATYTDAALLEMLESIVKPEDEPEDEPEDVEEDVDDEVGFGEGVSYTVEHEDDDEDE